VSVDDEDELTLLEPDSEETALLVAPLDEDALPDRAELARRLAEEAKARLRASSGETPQELARRLAAEAKGRLKGGGPTGGGSTRGGFSRKPIPADPGLEDVTVARARPAPPPRPRRTGPAASPPTAPLPAAPRAEPVDVGPRMRAGRVLAELVPMAMVEGLAEVRDREEFCETWRSHRAEAVRTSNLALVGAASALLHAAERGVELVSARVTLGQTVWVGWVDPDAGAVVALVKAVDAPVD
jgi:hypothetical protein